MLSEALPRPHLVRVSPPHRPLTPLRLLRGIVRNPIETFPQGVYETPIYRTRFFGRETVFVSDPELVRQVLVDQADAFQKAESMRRALRPALGDAILTAEGAHWRWQRRAAAPIFRHERILDFAPAMLAAASRTGERWLSAPDGTETDVAHEMMRTTFDIIVETMLSGPGTIDVDRVERGVTDYLEATGWTTMLALLKAPEWTPYPGRRRANAARDYLKAELLRMVANRRDEKIVRDDLIGLLLQARDRETGQAMGTQDVADNLLTFITAGHETTALALTWTFYLLSLHPDVESKVLDEIETVTAGAQLTTEHVGSLRYARQVISEAMRLYPPAPMVVRAATRDVVIGDEHISRGTPTYIPIYAVHRHRALWPDPDRFDPERFQPENVARRHKYAYLPFGAGPRICIGMSFAMTEAVAILATLIRVARLELRPGHTPELKMRVTLRPGTGMPMRVAKR